MDQLSVTSNGLSLTIADGIGSPLISCDVQDADGIWRPGLLPRSSELPGETPFSRFGNPFLFPTAGRSYAYGELGSAAWQGQRLTMPLHGIGYQMNWSVAAGADPTRSLTATASFIPKSSKDWPFPCRVKQTWTIDAPRTLHHECLIQNDHPKASMPLAAGFHPFFVISDPWDTLSVHLPAKMHWMVNAQGLGDNPTTLAAEQMPLSDPIFSNGIVGDLTANQLTVLDSNKRLRLRIRWDELCFRYLVFWTHPAARVMCLEPWMNLPDALARPAELAMIPARGAQSTFMEMTW